MTLIWTIAGYIFYTQVYPPPQKKNTPPFSSSFCAKAGKENDEIWRETAAAWEEAAKAGKENDETWRETADAWKETASSLEEAAEAGKENDKTWREAADT